MLIEVKTKEEWKEGIIGIRMTEEMWNVVGMYVNEDIRKN